MVSATGILFQRSILLPKLFHESLRARTCFVLDEKRRSLGMKFSGVCLVLSVLFFASNAVAYDRCSWPKGMPIQRVLLMGEVHGTNESPAFVGQLACATAKAQKSLSVGLEITVVEQARIDRYLVSRGTRKDRLELIAGTFWTRKRQDGRSSQAMYELIERLRKLRHKGADITVVAVDETVYESREAGMARNIQRLAESSKDQIIVLLGNLHPRKTKGVSWDHDYEPIGYRLSQVQPFSVLISANVGSAWVCAPDCGVKAQKATDQGSNATGYVGAQSSAPGYDGVYRLSTTTASRPASVL